MIEFLKKLWQRRARARLKVAEGKIRELENTLETFKKILGGYKIAIDQQEKRVQFLETWKVEAERRTLEDMIAQREQKTYAQIMNEYFNGKEEDDG